MSLPKFSIFVAILYNAFREWHLKKHIKHLLRGNHASMCIILSDEAKQAPIFIPWRAQHTGINRPHTYAIWSSKGAKCCIFCVFRHIMVYLIWYASPQWCCSSTNINTSSLGALSRHPINMKSTFLGAILFAVAIVNQVSAIYVNQATYDTYRDECLGTLTSKCRSVPYCEISLGRQHGHSYTRLCTEYLFSSFLDYDEGPSNDKIEVCDIQRSYEVGTPQQIAASTSTT